MANLPNIWIPSPAIAKAFRILEEAKPDEIQSLWNKVIKAFEVLPGYAEKGEQGKEMAITKSKSMRPEMWEEIKDVFRRNIVKSVPGLKFGDREEDKGIREERLAADLVVARELFRRTYGVEIRIEKR